MSMYDFIHGKDHCSATTKCDDCGEKYAIGDWPYCPHGVPSSGTTAPFAVREDLALGATPSSLGERWRIMKEKGFEYRSPKMGMPGCEV